MGDPKHIFFWADEIFLMGGTWKRNLTLFYKKISKPYFLTLRETETTWELDFREGSNTSKEVALPGLDLDREAPDIDVLREWLWEAYAIWQSHVNGPLARIQTGPLSGMPLRFHKSEGLIDRTTDLTQLDWGRGEAAILTGNRSGGKSLLAARFALDFHKKGMSVLFVTRSTELAAHTFHTRWGVSFDSRLTKDGSLQRNLQGTAKLIPLEFRGQDIQALEIRIGREAVVDLIVVDIQMPGLRTHAQGLAGRVQPEFNKPRVLWTFEPSGPNYGKHGLDALPKEVSRSAAIIFEVHGAQPFKVLKSRSGPSGYRVQPLRAL